jgi:hypothetical protein
MKLALKFAAGAFCMGVIGSWIVSSVVLGITHGIEWVEEVDDCHRWGDCMGAIPFDLWFRGTVVASLVIGAIAACVVFVAEATRVD